MRSGRWSIPPWSRCRSGSSERSWEHCSPDVIGQTKRGSKASPVRFIPTWQRSLMGRYKDFWEITQESLTYTIGCLGLKHDAKIFDQIMDKYCHLDLYPDAMQALTVLGDYKLAILSNGSPAMLNALVHNSGLETILDATISVDAIKIFKPSTRAYELIEVTLGVSP